MRLKSTVATAPPVAAAVHRGRRIAGRRKVRTLVDSGAAGQVLDAVRDALAPHPTAVEQDWITRIERRRTDLMHSTELVEVVDYGSGRHARRDGAVPSARPVGVVARSSQPARGAYLLFCLVRRLGPATALELGACVGISAAYQAAAQAVNGHGRLVTMEGAKEVALVAEQTLSAVDLADRAEILVGPFAETLPGVVTELGPIDWAFIDGHHDEFATVDYGQQILRQAEPGAVLVFDDIAWSAGMRRAWRRIVADERFGLTVDLGNLGIAVVGGPARRLSIPYA